MRDDSIKDRAIKLRLQGFMYSEIQEQLGIKIANGTMSGWLSKLLLSQVAQQRLNEVRQPRSMIAQVAAVAANRKKRQVYFEELRNKHDVLRGVLENRDVAHVALAMLYLGEGGKSGAYVRFSNSNPEVIKLFMKLLQQIYYIKSEKFRVRIQCRADQDINVLESFWQDTTQIPNSQFYPTYIDQRTVGKPTKQVDYKGVCMLYYLSAEIYHSILISIDTIMGH